MREADCFAACADRNHKSNVAHEPLTEAELMRKIATLVGLLMGGAASAGAASDWPALPSSGFVTGRPAHKEDVAKGDAIFVAASKDKDIVIGKPLSISIPQYALLNDTHQRVIVVQAEEANGMKLFGVRGLDGKEAVVTETDLELLGTRKPTK
jgi:hypothetical protein